MFASSNSLNQSYECVNSFKVITHIEQVNEFIRLWAVDDSEFRTSNQGPQQDASPQKLSAKVEACLNRLSPLLIQTLPPDPSRLAAGSVCFAIVDGRLFRVRLLTSPLSDLSRVVVHLIDYGYEQSVSHSDLRSHDSDILNCPPLAAPYYLDCFKLRRALSFETINDLKSKITLKKKLVRTKSVEGDFDLIDVITDLAVTLVELLIHENWGYRVTVSEMRRSLVGNAAPTAPPASGQENADAQLAHQISRRNAAQNRLYKFQTPSPTQQSPPGGITPLSVQPPNYNFPAHNQPSPGFAPTYPAPNLLMSSQLAFRQAAQQPLSPRTSFHQENKGKENCTSSALLVVGSCHDAYVTAVNDGPYQFTIQLKTDVEETLPRLKHVLASHPPVPVSAPLIPGSMVMGQNLTDKSLRRAVVSKVESDSCILYYVDYGTSESLPSKQIFKLMQEAAEYSAALGLQFRLTGLGQMAITDKDKEYFKRLVLNKRATIAVKESDSGPGFLQYCEMFIDGENVREILEMWKMPLHFAPQYPPPDNLRITVSHVDSPSTFFVQYESELNVLQTIQSAVQKHCNFAPPISDKSEVTIGSAVASLYPDDGSWYRSMVVDCSNDSYTVFYVDYGNRSDVRLSDLRKLNRELVTKWKSQAVECCLNGFDTLGPNLKTAELMEELTLGKFFTMRLFAILNGTRLKVDLIDPKGGSVSELMRREHEKLTSSLLTNLLSPTNPKPVEGFDQGFSSRKKDYGGGDDRSVSSGSESGVNNKSSKSHYQENRYRRPGERSGRDKEPPTPSSNRRNPYCEHDDRTQEDYSRNGGRSGGDDGRSSGGYGRKPYGSRGGDSFETGSYGGGRTPYGDRGSSDGPDPRSKFSDKSFRFSRDGADRPKGRFNDGGDYSGNKFSAGGRNDYGDRRGGDGDRRSSGYRGNNGDNSNQRKPKLDSRDRGFGASNAHNMSNGLSTGKVERSWDDCDADIGWGDASTADVKPTPAKCSHPEVMEYPKRELDGAEYSVILAQLEAPDVAYVQMADCEPILNEIRAEINADTDALSRPCSVIKKGSPVLAVYVADGLLYRAIVRDSHIPEVLYVDYGNSAAVAKTQIFTITPKLAEKPPQAVRVVLSDSIGPPGGGTEWPPFQSETYDAHYGVDTLSLAVGKLKIVDNELVVYGSLKRADGVDIATALVDNRLASFISKSGGSVLQNDAATNEITSKTEQMSLNGSTRGSPIDSLDLLKGQYLYARIECKFSFDFLLKLSLIECENKLVIAKCVNCNFQEGSDVIMYVMTVKEGILEVKLYDSDGVSPEGKICPLCPAPVFRRKERVYLSSIEGPVFYYQKVSDHDRLTTLTNELYEFYQNYEGGRADWRAGEICCAKSYDGNWYRAEIVEGPDVTVRYLDYGNIETVDPDCVKELDKRFITNQSAMAVIASMGITWKTEDVGPIMDGQVLEAFMIFEDDMWMVDFKLLDGTRFIDMLDQKKLAVKHSEDAFAKNMLANSWLFTPGSTHSVVVTHADAPDLFWVHLTSDVADIDALQSAMQDVAEEGPMSRIFAAKFSDEAWYRAVSESEDKVRFIDYGNCDVPLEKRPLKCDKLKRPERGYAVKVRLCARPIYGSWCDEAMGLFEGFIENENLFAVVIKSDCEIVVDLKSGNELVSDKLIKEGYAAYWDYENPLTMSPCRAFVSDLSNLNSFHVQLESVTDDLESLREKFGEGETLKEGETKLNQMVAAKFPDDDLWYRAVITSVSAESSTKRAYFIDFGNSADVTDVRKLPEDLAVVPPCSIHCSLNVSNAENTLEMKEKFIELSGSGAVVLNVTFRNSKDPRWVYVETEEKTNLLDCLGLKKSSGGPAGDGEKEGSKDSGVEPSPNEASGLGESHEERVEKMDDDAEETEQVVEADNPRPSEDSIRTSSGDIFEEIPSGAQSSEVVEGEILEVKTPECVEVDVLEKVADNFDPGQSETTDSTCQISDEFEELPESGQCTVTVINSPEDLYIQDVRKSTILARITESLREDAPTLSSAKRGDHGFVVHRSVPKRCSVNAIEPPSVFLYDYGVTLTEITLSDIRVLPESVSTINPVAILCSLGVALSSTEIEQLKALLLARDLVADYELDSTSSPPTINLSLSGVPVRDLLRCRSTPSSPSFQIDRDPLPVITVEQIRADAKSRVFDKTGKLPPDLPRRRSINHEKLLPGCVAGIFQ